MKAILFLFSIFFSTSVFSENVYLQTNNFGWDAPYYGGIAGGGYHCGPTSCTGSQYTTFFYIEQNVTGVIPEDNNDYFYLNTDLPEEGGYPLYKGLFRTFVAGQDFITKQDFDFTVAYDSFGLEDLKFYNTSFINLNSPSGSFNGSAEAGQSFSIAMMGLLSDPIYADDAFFTFELTFNPTSISEVPLPASMFFLAPALLGLIGFRRRLS